MSVDTRPDIWYQEDGATSRTVLAVMEWLKNRFGKDIISYRPDFSGPARSPDFSPLDFLLSGDTSKKRILRPNLIPLTPSKNCPRCYCISPSRRFNWFYSKFSKRIKSQCLAAVWPFRPFILEYINKIYETVFFFMVLFSPFYVNYSSSYKRL